MIALSNGSIFLYFCDAVKKQAVIRKEKGQYILYTSDGSRVLGRHKTRLEAIKQEYAIQKSKEREMKKSALAAILGIEQP